MQKTNNVRFLGAVTNFQNITFNAPNFPHCVFLGRSNVGKSSFINSLTESKIAKTSKVPGRTRQAIFFEYKGRYTICDLPGYGYASGHRSEHQKMSNIISEYLSYYSRQDQKDILINLLVDIRRGIGGLDLEVIEIFELYQYKWNMILTKLDKLSSTEAYRKEESIRRQLQILNFQNIIFTTSSKNNKGIKTLNNYFYNYWKV